MAVMKTLRVFPVIVLLCGLCGCGSTRSSDAKTFLDEAEKKLFDLVLDASQAAWVQSTYITDDSEAVAARANERSIAESVRLAKAAVQFDKAELPADQRRKMNLLKVGLVLAAPSNPAESAEVTRLAASLEGRYGKGKYCPDTKGGAEKPCMDIAAVTRVLATSNNPAEILDAWRGWHTISPPMRKDYQRFVELANKGARELGFKDSGAMWRSKYDLTPDEFAKEVDRLWEQVRPLYVSLHSYVRWKLREKYGASVVPEKGPIPAHLLGNIWAQDWSNTYKLVAPAAADKGYDLTDILKKRNTKPLDMVHYGESFFKSLGFAPLPRTFWDRSMFIKPRDRDVVCHASAWDVDNVEDLRLKMCIDISEEDFTTVHHELGHSFYQRAYNKQSFLLRDSANDGFHEAIGDTIALSVTPEYLVKIGLLNRAPDSSKDIGLLLSRALEKIAFLPFGLMIDQWRWRVFSGEIPPDQYNQAWWDLRLKYQGVAPPVARSEADFDPGAKYHVAANVPYTRYFLSFIMQFQFHKALAKAAGCPAQGADTPLHRCSIYDNKEAGARLNQMLEMGLSRPWQDAMSELTGQRQIDATAILDYFAPLQKWLDEQNKGKPAGW
ncbi:MAG: peptidase M2 family protein [Bryobacterales bacterium]|nr:peptidase M2 family protein [Bryobacterales bacterium]